MSIKCKIILRACRIRMARGEQLDAILASYPALAPAEASAIRAALEPETPAERT